MSILGQDKEFRVMTVETSSRYASLSFVIRAQLLAFVAYVPYYGYPVWWGLLIKERHYNLLNFGLVQTAKVVGLTVSSIILLLFIKRVNRSLLSCLAALMLASFYLGVLVFKDIEVLIGLYVLQGAAANLAWTLGSIYIGFTPHPERQFAVQVGLQTVAQSAASLFLPRLFPLIGNGGIQIVYAIALASTVLLLIGLPARLPDKKGEQAAAGVSVAEEPSGISIWWAGIPIVLATILYYNYLLNVYNYSERVGAMQGLDLDTVGVVLAFAIPLGIVGSAFGAVTGNRFGRVVPIAIGGVMGGLAVLCLQTPGVGVLGFAAGIALFGLMWSLVKPYIFAQTIAIDRGGRVMIVGGFLIAVGGIGMASATTAITTIWGLRAMLWFSGVGIILVPVMAALSALFMHRSVVERITRHFRRNVPGDPSLSTSTGGNG